MSKSLQKGIRNIQRRTKSVYNGMNENEEEIKKLKKHWLDWLDCSEQSTYVHTLAKRIKQQGTAREFEEIVHKKQPALITDLIFATNINALTINLPKVKDSITSPLNFSFGATLKEQKENYKKMLETPKTLILTYTHEYVEDGRTYNILQLYFVAPELANSDLPVIYKLDILTSPDKTQFYGTRASALVGGCVDGYCTLFQIGKLNNNTARLYVVQSGHTNIIIDYEDDVSNTYYKISELENIHNVFEASNYAFSLFNIRNRIDTPNETKIFEIIQKLNKNTLKTAPLTGDELVKAYLEHGIEPNDKKVRQIVYNKNEIEEEINFSFKK